VYPSHSVHIVHLSHFVFAFSVSITLWFTKCIYHTLCSPLVYPSHFAHFTLCISITLCSNSVFITHFTSIVISIALIMHIYLALLCSITCIFMHQFTCNYLSFSSHVRRVRPSSVKSVRNTFQCSHHSETPGYVPMFLPLRLKAFGIRSNAHTILKHRDTSLCFSPFG